MDAIAGIPFAALLLDKDGEREEPGRKLLPHGITDLLVLSHGWKNDEANATKLYTELISNMVAASRGGMSLPARRFAVVGVYWPAFRYREDLTILPADRGVPKVGGAAAASGGDLSRSALKAFASEIADDLCIDNKAAFVQQALDAAGGGGVADSFLEDLRRSLTMASDQEVRNEHSEFCSIRGSDAVDALKQRGDVPPVQTVGGGGAAGLGDTIAAAGSRVLRGGKAAVASLLNQATYFEMKARAGNVGKALCRTLEAQDLDGVRVHLIGHSFGARLVSATVAASQTLKAASLCLLQGAYSHNGLGRDVGPNRVPGGFRRIIDDHLVNGPIMITRSRHDSAVGFFYAVASKISGEIAQGVGVRDLIGGPRDLYGGLGANGALAMRDGECVWVTADRNRLPEIAPGLVNNVLADNIVANHNDVDNERVSSLVWHAIKDAT